MRKPTAFAIALLSVAAVPAASQTATQTVSYEVQAINEISVSGAPSLTVSSATAGSPPNTASTTASYAITTNGSNMKITASINTTMQTGLTLTTNMTAPSGASSAGAVSLTTSAQDVVTGITGLNQSALNITYQLTATSAAGVVGPSSRIVTYTIVQGP